MSDTISYSNISFIFFLFSNNYQKYIFYLLTYFLSGKWILQVFNFLITTLITFFIFSTYNAVGQQADQKYAATFSEKVLIQIKLAILDLETMCPHLHYLHHDRGQLIQSCLFNLFNNNKIRFLFCSNANKPQFLFIYSHYFTLIFIFFQKMPKINHHHI